MKPLRFDVALKIAQYMELYLSINHRQALEFAFTQARGYLPEYNFGGLKFWNVHDRWRVTSELENTSKDRELLILMVNVKLAGLKDRTEAGKNAWLIADAKTLHNLSLKELDQEYAALV